jgi:hypothetical protein
MVVLARNGLALVLAIGAMSAIAFHCSVAAAPVLGAVQGSNPVKYPQWYTGIKEMTAAADAKRYKDALAIAMRLAAAPGIPPEKAEEIHGRVVRYAIAVRDYGTAAAMVDRMLAMDEGYRREILKTCVFLAVLQNRMTRAQECTHQFEAQ